MSDDAERTPIPDEDAAMAPEARPGEVPEEGGQRLGGLEALLGSEGKPSYSPKQVRRARELLTRLSACRRAVRFYPSDHPAVIEAAEDLAAVVGTYHAEGMDVELAFYEGEVLLGDQLLPEESMLFDQLIRDLCGVGLGSLAITRGVDATELVRAMRVLSADELELKQSGGLVAKLAQANVPHVIAGEVMAAERTVLEGDPSEEARTAYTGALSLMREMDRLVGSNRAVSSARIKGVVRGLVDNVLANRYAMLQLTGLKNYDEYTFYHSANVAILSVALGSMITQDYRFLCSLGVGALLHDIGKLSVDLNVLNKPGALTPEEWALVRQHPVFGAQMTSRLPGIDRAALVVVLEHHMRYDGTGYPARTPRRTQHVASRIVAVADSYDAMTSRRSYSVARVQDEAMSLLVRVAGSSLDPTLVRLFVQLMGVYPPRSVVRLTGGELAVVVEPSRTDPVRPVVRVIADANGATVAPFDIDLTIERDVSIVQCLDPRLIDVEVEDYV